MLKKKLILAFIFINSINTIINIGINNTCLGKDIEQKLNKVDMLLNSQEYRQASEILYELEQEYPDNPAILFSSSFCYLYLGRADISKNYANKYISIGKPIADIYNIKGAACEYLDELDSAIYCFSKAIEIDKKSPDAYFNRGKIYFNKKEFSLALSDFKSAKNNTKIKISKNQKNDKNINSNNINTNNINADIFIMLAQTYVSMGKYNEAVEEYKIAETIKQNNAFVLQNLGNLYYLLKDFSTAEKYYSKVLNIEPENLEVLNNRALCYNELGESEKAEIDQANIETIQIKTGIQLNKLKFKNVVSPKEDFSFSIPEDWRAFVSESPDINTESTSKNINLSDTTTILFFNPNFDNSISDYSITYDFGGELKLIKNVQPASQSTDIEQEKESKRTAIAIEFETERQEKINTFTYYKILSRKIFSPTEKLDQGFLKAECILDTNSNLRTQMEYYAVNNSGDLLVFTIWVPKEQSFFYEKLLEYIISTIKFE